MGSGETEKGEEGHRNLCILSDFSYYPGLRDQRPKIKPPSSSSSSSFFRISIAASSMDSDVEARRKTSEMAEHPTEKRAQKADKTAAAHFSPLFPQLSSANEKNSPSKSAIY
uniref:Uncharacterized protein n=1 Tax=Pristionchus pacificus TaxID=54126 RepID=A0A2A6C6N9_PRIPA|eukprot:PDM73723.1 hypothetical protein PRIPAC_41079 [Pristionchus pacificus]